MHLIADITIESIFLLWIFYVYRDYRKARTLLLDLELQRELNLIPVSPAESYKKDDPALDQVLSDWINETTEEQRERWHEYLKAKTKYRRITFVLCSLAIPMIIVRLWIAGSALLKLL